MAKSVWRDKLYKQQATRAIDWGTISRRVQHAHLLIDYLLPTVDVKTIEHVFSSSLARCAREPNLFCAFFFLFCLPSSFFPVNPMIRLCRYTNRNLIRFTRFIETWCLLQRDLKAMLFGIEKKHRPCFQHYMPASTQIALIYLMYITCTQHILAHLINAQRAIHHFIKQFCCKFMVPSYVYLLFCVFLRPGEPPIAISESPWFWDIISFNRHPEIEYPTSDIRFTDILVSVCHPISTNATNDS